MARACPQRPKCSDATDTPPCLSGATVMTGPGVPLRVRNGEDRDALCHRRAGEFSRYPDLLRGSRIRLACRAGARLRAERALMGEQEAALLAAGHRVITYDRRGF